VARVLWVVLGLNLAVTGVKAAVGLTTGSLALLADSIHSLLDASSNVVGLIGIAIAGRPPDESHPYGHRRVEALAALVIGLLIAAGLLEIIRNLVRGILGEAPAPEVGAVSTLFVALTVVVNLGISRLEARQGRLLGSTLLTADANHTMSDAAGSLVVLASFVGVWVGVPWADLVATAIVALIVGRAALGVLATNLRILSDHAQLDPREVHDVAVGVRGVQAVHHIRSRGMPDHVELDLRVHLDPGMSLRDAHERCHEVAGALCRAFPEVADVVIHPEPADEHAVTTLAPGVQAPDAGDAPANSPSPAPLPKAPLERPS